MDHQFMANMQNQNFEPVVAPPPAVRNQNLDDQLMMAAQKGEHPKIGTLIDQGAYVNMQDAKGSTPLMAAVEGNHVDAVKTLLSLGADVNLAKADGSTPLIMAYKGNKKKVLKELTAAAFQTLNKLVSNPITQNFQSQNSYSPDDEGISNTDLVQMKDETAKLIGMKTAPARTFKAKMTESAEDAQAANDGAAGLREGAVRMLLTDLSNASNSLAHQHEMNQMGK